MKASKIAFFLPISIACFILHQCISPPNNKKISNSKIIDTKLSLIYSDIEKGRYLIARKKLKNLSKKNPNNSKILNTLGISYLGVKNYKKSIRYFAKAYRMNPSHNIALNLSSAYIENKELRKALILLQSIIKSDSYLNKERAYHNIGYAYEKLNKYSLSEKFYKKALDENPTYYMPSYGLAIIYQKQKQTKQSIKFFKKAQQLCPACYEPIEKLSEYYLHLGKPKKAIQLMKKFISEKRIPLKIRNKIKKNLAYTKKKLRKTVR